MSADIHPFEIGQTVRVLPDLHGRVPALDVYTVVRCNEIDGPDPSYVIQSDVDRRQRREPHSRLRPVAAEGPAGSRVFVHRASS